MTSINHNASQPVAVSRATVFAPLRSTGRFEPTGELRPLRGQVVEIVNPRRDCMDKPPFTTGELIVIALVLRNLEPQSMHEIHVKILSIIPFYAWAAIEAYVSHIEEQPYFTNSHRDVLDYVVDGFYGAEKDFELPLTCTDTTPEGTQRYTISAAAARIYLRRHLEPSRKGTFDFMGLPAELREKVYKMLLLFPKPGLRYSEWEDVMEDGSLEKFDRLGLLSRDDSEAPVYHESTDFPQNDAMVGSLTQTLAILSVSKQIRQEAMHIFYGRNSFYFGTLSTLNVAFKMMTAQTLQHIRELRIVMEAWPNDNNCIAGAFACMFLKKLVVIAPSNTHFWVYIQSDEAQNPTDTPIESSTLDGNECLEPLLSLATRAKDVEIQGDGRVGHWLRMKLEQASKARQAAEQEDDESSIAPGAIEVVARPPV